MPNLIDFEWERHVDGYEFLQPAGELGLRWIRPINPLGEVIRYRPLDKHPALFAIFASLDGSEKSFVHFVNTYGPLDGPFAEATSEELVDEALDQWGSPLSFYTNVHAEMAELFRYAQEAEHNGDFRSFVAAMKGTRRRILGSMPSLEIDLRFFPGEARPGLVLVPQGLADAMKLQMVQAVCEERQLRKCVNCGNWFAFGVSGERQRKSAHYCSNRCKQAQYRKRKEDKHGIDPKT